MLTPPFLLPSPTSLFPLFSLLPLFHTHTWMHARMHACMNACTHMFHKCATQGLFIEAFCWNTINVTDKTSSANLQDNKLILPNPRKYRLVTKNKNNPPTPQKITFAKLSLFLQNFPFHYPFEVMVRPSPHHHSKETNSNIPFAPPGWWGQAEPNLPVVSSRQCPTGWCRENDLEDL